MGCRNSSQGKGEWIRLIEEIEKANDGAWQRNSDSPGLVSQQGEELWAEILNLGSF
jgi:hypothetical protein